MDAVTPIEAAGFAVGGLLFAATLAAPKVDNYIAVSQRRSLGLCEECGGLKKVACRKCGATGETRSVLSFLASFLDNKTTPSRCMECQGRGHFSCKMCTAKAKLEAKTLATGLGP